MIEVQQADIECFMAIFGMTADCVDADGDDREALQAIARHRIAAETAALERAVRVARGQLPFDVSPESPFYGLWAPSNDFDRGVDRGRETSSQAIHAVLSAIAKAQAQ